MRRIENVSVCKIRNRAWRSDEEKHFFVHATELSDHVQNPNTEKSHHSLPGFFLLFTSYKSLANLQSTLNIEDDVGIVSQSVIYVSLIISSLLLPKLIIRKLGCKWTLILSTFTYTLTSPPTSARPCQHWCRLPC
ncbi:hypothetical protein CEXT_75301 [Caerostris extrusa]|uniref:Uncharacterized protein n=1 Tax=Caerostris extrusa TaxID=172846 RepID=A0AAV4WKZ2_CAEEX|nr:hypothetical protein CEXT_75301 [Caerostris extrusa]